MPSFFNPYRVDPEDPKLCYIFATKQIVAVFQIYCIVMLGIAIFFVPTLPWHPVIIVVGVYIITSFIFYSLEEKFVMMILFWINVVGTMVFASWIAVQLLTLLMPSPEVGPKLTQELIIYFLAHFLFLFGLIFYTWMCLDLVKAVDLKNRHKQERPRHPYP